MFLSEILNVTESKFLPLHRNDTKEDVFVHQVSSRLYFYNLKKKNYSEYKITSEIFMVSRQQSKRTTPGNTFAVLEMEKLWSSMLLRERR